MQVCRQQTHRVGVQQCACAQRLFKNAQQVDRVFEECFWISHSQAVLQDRIRRLCRFAPFEQTGQHRFWLGKGGLLRGQKDAGQFADLGGAAKVVLHEMLDRAPSVPIGIAHARGDLDLHVKGQLIHRAPGQQV